MLRKLLLTAAILFSSAPSLCLACACGCGVFSVGTSSLFPGGVGGTAFLEYDYMNQDQNWSGTSSAPAADNPDKDIRTDFYTLGAQYMFNREWGVMAEVPYWDRLFVTTQADGSIGGFHHDALGDIRLLGMYTGFSADMSTGVFFGIKLPTGDYTYPNLDPDTSIGTGSTDTLLGVYHQGGLTSDNNWNWFAQGMWQRAFATRGGYRPGNELDAAAGVYYNGWSLGGDRQIAPVLQLVASDRLRDSGPRSNAPDSGYQRLFVAPGVEYDGGSFKVFADLQVPVYQDFNGQQLEASRLYKLVVSFNF